MSAQFNNYEAFDEEPKIMRKERIDGAMILWWVRWYGSYLPYQMRKPLYYCLPCMGSLWSIPAFVYLALPWYYCPLFALGTAGLNAFVLLQLQHMRKNYHRIHGFHYIMRGGEWYVLIEKKWHKCAPPTHRYPLLINDDIQTKTTRPQTDLEGSPGGAA